MKEKYEKILDEVFSETNRFLSSKNKLSSYQRGLAFYLSLGSSTLLEVYLDNQGVLKSGAKINHLWLKKKKENAKKFLEGIIVDFSNLDKLDFLLEIIREIEKDRNDLAYGPLVSDEFLSKKVSLFFKLKKEVLE